MRIVLDTNIFISGIFWDGNYCSQIIDAWRNGIFTLVSSMEIIQELVSTLTDFKIKMPDKMIEKWQNMIIENSVIVFPEEKLNIVKNDPEDNKFFEAAIAGQAEYIVSQDKKHVLEIKEYMNIKTINPEEMLKIINRLT